MFQASCRTRGPSAASLPSGACARSNAKPTKRAPSPPPSSADTHVLITHEGGVVCRDARTGGLVQRDLGGSAVSAAHCRMSEGSLSLHLPEEDAAFGAELGAELGTSERLMPVRLDDMARLRAFAAHRWLLDGDQAPTGRHALSLAPGFKVRLGGRDCSLAALLEALRGAAGARHPSGAPLSLVLFTATRAPVQATLFEPLICATVFGREHCFEQHALCVQSIERFGAYDGCYLIASDRDAQAAARGFAEMDPSRWFCLQRPLGAMESVVAARRQVLSEAAVAGFQPVLYLDTDVICDAPLEPLLVAALRSERPLIPAGCPRGEAAGIVAGRDHTTLAAAWRCDQFFGTAPQATILQARGLAETDRMAEWVTALGSDEPCDDGARRGLVHFSTGFGQDNVEAMRRHIEHLGRATILAMMLERPAIHVAALAHEEISG